ncbi:MAG: amino acid aminotransferase [Burkholderiaceae bacterium]
MSTPLFADVPLAPRDPILGITETFRADPRLNKANLGVGVYFGEDGKIPLLAAVRDAEAAILAAGQPHGYQPIEGVADYNKAVQGLLLGADSAIIAAGRAATFECLGGTGALKVAADFLHRLRPQARAWISKPSWENHRALFEYAGFEVLEYPYYDPATHGLNFAGMLDRLGGLPEGDVVVLHICCHNPTGVDLDLTQWQQVAAVCAERGLVPVLDLAYQGFAEGINEDAAGLRCFIDAGLNVLIASSFSKSFSLYGERIGALTITTDDADQTERVTSQVKRVIRTNYSNPPIHGGEIVKRILGDARLRATWEQELAGMRTRIRAMREGLVERLHALQSARDFSFVARQRGMFSYSGLNAAQVEHMAREHGIYAVSSGRICLAAINMSNIDAVAAAMADALARVPA